MSEESELEKEIKSEEIKEIAREIKEESNLIEINNFPSFKEISFSSEFRAPVLERVETSFESSNIEDMTNFSPSFFQTKEEQKKQTKYETIEADYETIEEDRKKRIRDENILLKTRTTPVLEMVRSNIESPFESRRGGLQFNPELQELERQEAEREEDYLVQIGKSEEDSRLPFQQNTKYKGKRI